MQISTLPERAPVPLPDGVRLLRANNAGPLTLAGTNTWILGRAGRAPADPIIVIDPGPVLGEHLASIRDAGRPAAIVLTHHHADHSEAAAALAAEFGIPIHAADAELANGTTPLVEGDLIAAAGRELRVMATPGHTSDSVCLLLGSATGGALFTGDTLLGGSTTIIAPPSGSLAEYFDTMARLSAFDGIPGFPGHGPAFSSVGSWARHNAGYRETRLVMLAETYTEIRSREIGMPGAELLARVAAAVYGEEGTPVVPYVLSMTDAQLRFLADRGDIAPCDGAPPPD